MISTVALREDAALLKLDLYCKGMRLDDSCFIEEDGGRKILRTRAGLSSGLELILPRELWTNVPVSEPFAAHSRYVLHRERGRYYIQYRDDTVTNVRLLPRPGWYDAETTGGKPMTRIGTLQGTYLGIYQAKVCEYWTAKPQKTNCKFCSVGLKPEECRSLSPRRFPWQTLKLKGQAAVFRRMLARRMEDRARHSLAS